MTQTIEKIEKLFSRISFPKMEFVDIVEIIILAFILYHVIIWVRRTRAWSLLKGIIVLLAFYFIAYFFNMSVILWVFNKTLGLGITALVIVFQPELRKALEQIGTNKVIRNIIPFDDSRNKNVRFTDRSLNEIVKASEELAKAKTGALIVIEREINLYDYERTGINIDAAISSQLLINIFEHNTPLHDGAVIVRDDRVAAATCYLPLTDNMKLSKELGTRHRAAVGISEQTDSLTIVVSEETGKISIAAGGMLLRNIDGQLLRKKLKEIQLNPEDDEGKKSRKRRSEKKEKRGEKE